MTHDELTLLLARLISEWEGECVEFKEANDNFSTSDIGKYFSALANEANLRGREAGWLVFGVENRTRKIVGSAYRQNSERLHSLKKQIADGSEPSTTLREIHELQASDGRVVLFEVPRAPRGIPIGWNGHYYARSHESLDALSISKLDEIRAQGAASDWSAVVCPAARLADLDPAAIAKARESFASRHRERVSVPTVAGWSDAEFLEKAKLTIDGGVPRGTLLLLGTSQSTHHLSPQVAEITWKLEGEETAYEHFHPPFLLETTRLYQRIRNLPLTLLPAGQLIPVEIRKYEERMVLEALHNCIAHQDYARCERIVVIERVAGLEFRNGGEFYDGNPLDYVLSQRTPRRYRNRFLAEAMVNLRMMDTMGFGIRDVLYQGQRRRFLPLPDYDLSKPGEVAMKLAGRFMDENYSRALLAHSDFSIDDVLGLDGIQKGRLPDDATIQRLRRRGLIEGRKPAIHISASVAAAAGQQAQYINTRRQDDAHYRHLILDYLRQFGASGKDELRRMLANKWPQVLTAVQRENKLHNLISALRKGRLIERLGGFSNARWRLSASDSAAARATRKPDEESDNKP